MRKDVQHGSTLLNIHSKWMAGNVAFMGGTVLVTSNINHMCSTFQMISHGECSGVLPTFHSIVVAVRICNIVSRRFAHVCIK